MKSWIWLRVAAVLGFVHAALHTVGGVFGKVAPGPASTAVAAMQANRFLALGVMRSYWEYYRGMGLAVAIFLIVEAAVFWELGSIARAGGRSLRAVLITFAVGYVAMAVNSFLYFFSAPVIVELAIAVCLGLACVGAGSSERAPAQ